MEARPFIEHLCSDLEFSLAGARPIRIVALCVDIELKLSQTTTLGLLINELVTNALKHAFPGDRAGTVTGASRLRRRALPAHGGR
jgi:two-component sensor histidine kinase